MDIEAYIGEGFMAAIKGFQSQEWGIRNSALMLFSAISQRILGVDKVADQHSVKNKINIIEFFTRAPTLVDYFLNEVKYFLDVGRDTDNQYPAIYPITLIFSRLLPYDFKNNYMKKSVADDSEGQKAEGEEETKAVDQEEEKKEGRKFISLEEINKFLPLFREAANNKNYMGRLMTARAILPFVPFEKIGNQVLELLEMPNLSKLETLKKNHNFVHGLLLQVYLLAKNYYKLKPNYPVELVKWTREQHF